MRIAGVGLSPVFGLLLFAVVSHSATAALPPEARKELAEISRELRKVGTHIRKEEYDQAEKILDQAESVVKKHEEGNRRDRQIAALRRQIGLRRAALTKAQNDGRDDGPQISFNRQIAPILKKRCGNCHVDRASGGLQFDTFANLKKGGRSGAVIVEGMPLKSLLYRRLIAPPNRRMPKNGNTLPKSELTLIAGWIKLGAPFDGENRSAPIGEGGEGGKTAAGITIPRPEGDETVSFIRDVAPFIVNLCTRCHSGDSPNGGFSVVTFEDLMKGSDSGRVLLPGNLDGSLLWQLVGTPQPADRRMPQGRARITKTNHGDLRTWIQEGCKFDGDDPTAPLRGQILTEEELTAERLAKLSAEEFREHRLKRTHEQWERALPNNRPQYIEGKQVLVYGDVGAERMQAIYQWAEDHVKRLRSAFNLKGKEEVWKGRLTIFVIKDRFGYEEFNVEINNRGQIPQAMIGHSVVTVAMQDAYVALHDVGDDITSDNPGMKFNVIENVTGAFLKRSAAGMPDWLVRGTGIMFAAREMEPDNPYLRQLQQSVPGMLASVAKPEDVFADGTFSPSAVGAVGYSLVKFMLNNGGVSRFSRFVGRLQAGDDLGAAMKAVYQADPGAVAIAFKRSVTTKR